MLNFTKMRRFTECGPNPVSGSDFRTATISSHLRLRLPCAGGVRVTPAGREMLRISDFSNNRYFSISSGLTA